MAADAPGSGSDGWVVVFGEARGFANQVVAGTHRFPADEPEAAGGTDTGPGPYDLLLAALGTCTSMTVSLFARRRKWPLESVTVRLRHSRIYVQDCERCEKEDGRVDRIEREITLAGKLDPAQRQALLAIADKCPVHRTLTHEIRIDTRLV